VAVALGASQSTLATATYPLSTSPPYAIRLRTEMGCQTGANCAGVHNGEHGNVYTIYGASVQLYDPSLPVLSTVDGPGWRAAPADGVSNIDYTVTDTGSGLSEVRFLVDGIQYGANPSSCVAGRLVPCPLSASGTFALDTTRLSEGDHKIALVAIDHSGNATTAAEKQLTITVRRAPQASTTTPVSTTNPGAGGGSPAIGDQLHGHAGGWAGEGMTYAYQWLRCDANGLSCVPIPGATGPSHSVSAGDVGRALVFCVTATNSGGSAKSCSPPSEVVVAARPSAAVDRSGHPVGSPGTAAGGTGERGHPNGSPASDRVVLTALVNSKSVVQKVGFGRHAPISGRLVGPDGAPIRGATLTVQTQSAIPGAAMADAAHVVTGTDGRFHYMAPPGPSRIIRLGYRSHTADTAFADTTDVRLLVSAGVTMRAKPTKVRNRNATVFTGRLLGGPIPARGVVVELQVLLRKQWRTFAAPRANRAGVYRFRYRFMAGAATWRFRARVRQESSYPYEVGFSGRPVTVRVIG
jgi:hypothetical protein